MDISKSVQIALIKAGKNKGWLAGQLEVSHQRVSQICGSTTCNSNLIQRMAGVFNMKPSEFIALGEE